MKILFNKTIKIGSRYYSLFDCVLILAMLYGVVTIEMVSWIGFVILIVAVVIHEVAHGLMANVLGDPTAKNQGRLSLNPLVHVDPLGTVVLPLILVLMGSPFLFGWAKPVPVVPSYFKNQVRSMMWVALAGPVSNAILALIASQALKFFIIQGVLSSDHIITEALFSCVIINLVLALFNMIPIPPLDGSRVIMVVLPEFLKKIWTQLEHYGLFIVMGLVYLGVFDPILEFLIKLSLDLLFN